LRAVASLLVLSWCFRYFGDEDSFSYNLQRPLLIVMLHILNGFSTEGTLRQSGISGDFFSFRDALIAGPSPSGLDDNAWRRTRAAYLSQSYGVAYEECERDLFRQSDTLSSFTDHDEVVLWFEHDLFCQLNLLYLLNWFRNVELGNTKLSLVNIGAFPGRENFRGLGELTPDELESLFPERQSVSNAELQLAEMAFQAFCSPDPTSIEGLLQRDTSPLPFLAQAFQAHLKRFPATKNGLGQVENTSLELIDRGHEKFGDLFLKFMAAESVYGLGDAQLWLALVGLANAKDPLVVARNGSGVPRPGDEIGLNTEFHLTSTGKKVLEGKADFVKLNEIDEWLGGVHLQGNQLWRWDEQVSRLRYC
jgi:hypothetical protein